MNVAIVHYHLGQGGVFKVIATASRLMSGQGIPHVILAGPSPEDPPEDLPVRIVGRLAYSASTGLAAMLLEELRTAARSALGQAPDIWHFHNHSLGKNPRVPEVVALLAAENERLLLQIHDLAEDGRPENAARLTACRNLYPLGTHVHYAFLNSRDRGRFIAAGLAGSRAHPLPNPIEPEAALPLPSGPPLLFYPVRGIRRKNLGELVLLTALAPADTRAAVAHAPLNPSWQHIHEGWRRFSAELRLPVEFDVVDHLEPAPKAGSSFESWLEHATHIVTTSVSEGFGMVFLESIARGKPLLGRNLPHIARDHAAHGIRAGRLYDRLLIPGTWIDGKILDPCLRESLAASWQAWGHPLPFPGIETARAALLYQGFLDFGNLPEFLQQDVIRKLTEPAMKSLPLIEAGGRSFPAADWLAENLGHREPTATPAQLSPHTPSIYQKNLSRIYQQLMHETPAAARPLEPQRILDSFLHPANFHFLTAAAAAAPPSPDFTAFRAIILDVYGTLLIAPPGGVKPDPAADPLLREIIARSGHQAPESPSTALHAAVLRHHAAATVRHPEIDLRDLWREVLALPPETDTGDLVIQLEAAWHPVQLMPGAVKTLRALATAGIPLGLLSNAQCDTLPSLAALTEILAADLVILSYRHGIAKPSPILFELLAARLAKRGITPAQTLFIGNDPLHDIIPAAAHGFRTALFTGHPDSFRAGACLPDYEIRNWNA